MLLRCDERAHVIQTHNLLVFFSTTEKEAAPPSALTLPLPLLLLPRQHHSHNSNPMASSKAPGGGVYVTTRATAQTVVANAGGFHAQAGRVDTQEAWAELPRPASVDEEDAGGATLPPPDWAAIAEEEAEEEDEEATHTPASQPSVGVRRSARGRRGSTAPRAPRAVEEDAEPGGSPPPEPHAVEEEGEDTDEAEEFATPADALGGGGEAAAAAARTRAPAPRVLPASLPPPPESQGELATPKEGRGAAATRAATAAVSTLKRNAYAAKTTPTKVAAGPPKAKAKKKRARGGAPRSGPPARDAVNSYARAIHATLQAIASPVAMTLSKKAAAILNDMLVDVRDRLAGETGSLMRVRKAVTLTAADVQAATRLCFPGELAKHAVIEGSKAVSAFDSATRGGPGR